MGVGSIDVLVLNAKISAGDTYRSNINNMTDSLHHYLMRCLGFVHTGAVLICYCKEPLLKGKAQYGRPPHQDIVKKILSV
jgi:hypothetical protein